MVKESEIEKAVCDYAKGKGCYVRKFSSPAHRGVPDRLFITPDGVVFFIEFKALGKTPTALQYRELTEIAKRGGNAHWADNQKDGLNIVDKYV